MLAMHRRTCVPGEHLISNTVMFQKSIRDLAEDGFISWLRAGRFGPLVPVAQGIESNGKLASNGEKRCTIASCHLRR